MMGELNYFLGLQIKQTNDGIFVNQAKYCKEVIKWFGMENSKHLATPMNTSCYLDKDESSQPVDPKQYREVWLDLYFTYLQVGQILCLGYACVQDFNQIQSFHI